MDGGKWKGRDWKEGGGISTCCLFFYPVADPGLERGKCPLRTQTYFSLDTLLRAPRTFYMGGGMYILNHILLPHPRVFLIFIFVSLHFSLDATIEPFQHGVDILLLKNYHVDPCKFVCPSVWCPGPTDPNLQLIYNILNILEPSRHWENSILPFLPLL